MEAPTSADNVLARARRRSGKGFRVLLAGLLVSGGTMALARFPAVVERTYASAVGPAVARALSLLTGWSPVSIGAVLALSLLGVVAWKGLRGVRRIRAGEPARRVIVRGADWSAGVAGIVLIAFYVSWGLNYARPPLDERLGMTATGTVDAAELRELTGLVARRTNEAYRRLHGGRADAGEPTEALVGAVETSRALEVGWRRVASALGLGSVATARYGPVKTLGVTRLLDFLDIAGLYVPFTGEAHVSGAQPDVSFPAVAAHEQAHQRGLARENEATFAGVLAAIHADDPLVHYSGWARILRALHADLGRADPEAAREVGAMLLPGVVRDWRDYAEWLRRSRSTAAPIVNATNDAYLRAHGVPGGIESYGRVTTLLVEWSRRHAGLLVAEGGSPAG